MKTINYKVTSTGGMLFAVFMILLCLGLSLAGWLTNLFWTFDQESVAKIILGAIGVFAAPIGIIHGLYLMF